jgi:polyprenyldihydroxybenzoate methyltransferase/3-demethylubiquinol 3-O-methyltransferase
MSTIARTWASWIVTKVVAEELLGVVPKGTHEWGKYLNEDELRGFFNAEKGWRGNIRSQGCAYIPGLGWKMVPGGEKVGNYFIAAQRDPES